MTSGGHFYLVVEIGVISKLGSKERYHLSVTNGLVLNDS